MLKQSCVSRIRHQISVTQKVENVFTLVIKTCYFEKVTGPMLKCSCHQKRISAEIHSCKKEPNSLWPRIRCVKN